MSDNNKNPGWEAAWNANNRASRRGRSRSRSNFDNQNVEASTIPSRIDQATSRSRSRSRANFNYPPQGSMLPSGLDNGASRNRSLSRNGFANPNIQDYMLPPSIAQGGSNNYQMYQRSLLPSQIDNRASSSSSHHWHHQSQQYPRTAPDISVMNSRLDRQPRGPNNSFLQSNLDHQSQQYQYPRPGEVSVMDLRLDQRSRGVNNSFLQSNLDRSMAARQTGINSLPPGEKQKQDEWALQYLAMSGSCVAGYAWVRADEPGKTPGYRCMGFNHFVSDELIAEGKGGYFERSRKDENVWKLKYPSPGKMERNAVRGQKIGDLMRDLPSSRW